LTLPIAVAPDGLLPWRQVRMAGRRQST